MDISCGSFGKLGDFQMEHIVKEYGKAVMASLIAISCIGILVSGVFIGTSGLNATGARELAGSATETQEADMTENRVGPELDDIATVPDSFQIQCQSQVIVDEIVDVDALFRASNGEDVVLPVSITQITDADGNDALSQGQAERSNQGVMLHSPGIYQFYVKVAPVNATGCFHIFCKEQE